MPAAYFDRNGNIRISFFCGNPRVHRSDRGHCGARTRKGASCKAPPVWNKANDEPKNGRCKLHGGLSTDPKTEAGRDAIRASNRRRGKQDCKHS